jgi:hypothetical protein
MISVTVTCHVMFIWCVKAVSSGSTNAAFRHDVTLNSEVVEHGISYAVRIVSVTQYVVKESRKLVLPTISLIFFFFKISKLKIGHTFHFMALN